MKAYIYTRTSSTEAQNRQNNERQVVDLRNYAAQRGYEICGEYNEKISGAVKNEKRLVLNNCINSAIENNIDIILTSELSRVGRSVWEVQETLKKCRDNKINVFFQKEGISLFNEDGSESFALPILISVLGVCASMERENIKFRLNSGRKYAVEHKGVKLGRPAGSQNKVSADEKYQFVIRELRKGKSAEDVLAICEHKDIKCSIATIYRLKKKYVG